MDATDKDRKKIWKQQQRKLAQASFPVSDALLESMFAIVGSKVDVEGCDHTLRFTEAWVAEHKQPKTDILSWLREQGGFCDCEVLANAADHWRENR